MRVIYRVTLSFKENSTYLQKNSEIPYYPLEGSYVIFRKGFSSPACLTVGCSYWDDGEQCLYVDCGENVKTKKDLRDRVDRLRKLGFCLDGSDLREFSFLAAEEKLDRDHGRAMQKLSRRRWAAYKPKVA